MREIKFRGKTYQGKWIYGYCYKVQSFFDLKFNWFIRGNHQNDEMIIPETLSQYTGLKDKNGVEIYEGDIVRCKLIDQIKKNGKWINVETFEKYEVIYSNEDLGFRFKDEWMSVWKFENCELEVIGNIYENKLKEEGK